MEINQYPLESFAFQDEDYYDIDFWTGSGYQTKKILGSVIKAGILSGVVNVNIYNSDGSLTGDRNVTLDGGNLILKTNSNDQTTFEGFKTSITSSLASGEDAGLVISSPNDLERYIELQNSGLKRWKIRTFNNELGSDTGSDLVFQSYNDIGAPIGEVLKLTRTGGIRILASYNLPNTDGTAGQVMTTDGAGVVSWQDPSTPSTVDSAKREVVEFINKTGAPILEGTIVYLKTSSVSGTHPEVELADASTEATSSKTIGAIYETTANDAIGLIVTSGEVDNLDTSMYSIGDRLWLSTTAGQVTTTPPTAPNHAVFIGIVTRSQNGNGRILYSIQNGYELREIHDVSIPTTPNNGDVLTYNSVTGLWEAEAVVGSNIYNTDGTLTGSRVVSLVNNDLTFSGNGSERFIVNIDDGTNAVVIDVANAFGVALSASSSGGASLLQITTAGININGQYNLPNTAGTNGQVMRVNGSGNVVFQSLPVELQVACSDEISAITAGTGKLTFRMPHSMTLTGIRASLTTAQISGLIFTIDVIQNGVSLLSTKLTIDNTERTSTTAVTPAVIAISSLTDDAEIRIDVTQIGDSTAKGLKVTLLGTRS